MNHPSPRNRPYIQALQRLSARTGAPLSSLVVSFGILHEVTALVPLVGVFFGARAVGAGDRAIELVPSEWVKEGEEWAGRVGRRYGLFGFQTSDPETKALAGDVANAVLAYAVVKASHVAPQDRSFLMARSGIFQASVGPAEDSRLAAGASQVRVRRELVVRHPSSCISIRLIDLDHSGYIAFPAAFGRS